jgi:transcriptional regulator with XRE-family HTH domain
MFFMRQVNAQKLQMLIRTKGHNALAIVASDTGISSSTLSKLAGGRYSATPKEQMQLALCDYFSIDRDVLFPPVGAGKKRKAS